ncbi:unnamed protein product [Toxocara canis]|uniref:Nuclear receptor domain-containing protein n=1 Tax=Toxocara canis TaxID=6265 RepID=A0A183UD05_TOXCA|nr:unnamed protein product [Toxocara canis]
MRRSNVILTNDNLGQWTWEKGCAWYVEIGRRASITVLWRVMAVKVSSGVPYVQDKPIRVDLCKNAASIKRCSSHSLCSCHYDIGNAIKDSCFADQRNACRYCRFQRCLDVGMEPDGILFPI